MFEIGWSEMLLCAIVALVVVGPKDLPHMMRAFGRWVAQLRGLAAQFQRSMEEAAREMDSEDLRDAQKSFRDLKSIRNPFEAAMRGVTDAMNAPTKKPPSSASGSASGGAKAAGAPPPATPSPPPSLVAPATPLPSGEGDAAPPPAAAAPLPTSPASAASDPSR